MIGLKLSGAGHQARAARIRAVSGWRAMRPKHRTASKRAGEHCATTGGKPLSSDDRAGRRRGDLPLFRASTALPSASRPLAVSDSRVLYPSAHRLTGDIASFARSGCPDSCSERGIDNVLAARHGAPVGYLHQGSRADAASLRLILHDLRARLMLIDFRLIACNDWP